MPKLDAKKFEMDRCPHCSVHKPHLGQVARFETKDHTGAITRRWICYSCANCGGVVTAWASNWNQETQQIFPDSPAADANIPERPRAYLQQAIDTVHAPAGSVMLAASSVDSMLKLKGYAEGSLYTRITKAAHDHLITNEMANWAHEVRLDANDQRHADDAASLPTTADAQRCIEFVQALAQFLFVLPSRVQRGLANAQQA